MDKYSYAKKTMIESLCMAITRNQQQKIQEDVVALRPILLQDHTESAGLCRPTTTSQH